MEGSKVMFLKPVKDGVDYGLYPCSHILKRRLDDGAVLRVVVCGGAEGVPPHIDVPLEADIIYVMNDGGDTVDTVVWPLPARKVAV